MASRADLKAPHEGGATTGDLCIGVDVGGTFTDVVLSNGRQVWRAKAASIPGALGLGVIAACELVAERAGLSIGAMLSRVERFGLGTTAVTNDIASRTGRKVGLITTRGFEDLVPIARVRRVSRDGWLVPPDSLVERDWIVGVDERIDRDGDVLQPLDAQQAVVAAQYLHEQLGVEALVVSFLWSCRNPSHETAAVAAIREVLPQLPVLSAAELHPVAREYERTTFALLNAYTSGSLDGIDELVEELLRLGLPRAPLLIHSGGGSITVKKWPEHAGGSCRVRSSSRCCGRACGLPGCRDRRCGCLRHGRHLFRYGHRAARRADAAYAR